MCSQEEESRPFEPILSPPKSCMHKFRLYETRSKFYLVGRDKSRTYWRVLAIDRTEPCELNIHEDSTTYTETECSELLKRIHEGNKSVGGLKFVTTCYGIVGFIKFLGPYYMLIITKRRQIGSICGHAIYAVSQSELVSLPYSEVQAYMIDSRNECRYKKLLCMVDLTKDFYFSYSYHIMRTLQRNLCDRQTGHLLYETMFVWNEFLTREVRNSLQNTIWTVALVFGFFKQETLSVAGHNFKMTLIARRSRHYAGTRYLRRGVNEKGRVANDVETEQIVFEDAAEGLPVRISSVVQNRGSIPLYWSQETSRLNIKPDIILSKKDQNYEATRLHFENLAKRYGNPIIILNLIKTVEKKPRESILRTEFANAIEHINKDLPEENRLKFLHWDLNKHARSKATNVLLLLGRVATYALMLTGFFYCRLLPFDDSAKCTSGNFEIQDLAEENDPQSGHEDSDKVNGAFIDKRPMFQSGVLRTNCIDCLDRTNVAQFAYGLAALGHQLHALDMIDVPKLDLDSELADDLMGFYEKMGDTLAHQYGGSAAHNKIFSERRGQWKAATQSQEFFRTLQRYYSNAYMDVDKQNAINVFLGHFQPQPDKPALWELGPGHHYSAGRNGQADIEEDGRSLFKRCWSDGSILRASGSPNASTHAQQQNFSNLVFPDSCEGSNRIMVESSPDMSTTGNDTTYYRYSKSLPRKQFYGDVRRENYVGNDHIDIHERKDSLDCSNFVDLDWLSSSGNSCEEDCCERSMSMNSAGLSSDNVMNGVMGETTPSSSQYGSGMKAREPTTEGELLCSKSSSSVPEEFSESFVRWVTAGETLCH
ncbi:Phosphoinositide phosphatase SAC4 [Bienertia sinuspersici]